MNNEEQHPTFRIGPIRPPSEANSLLLQVTQGCTWNKCKFCELYRGTKFQAFSVESIKRDIDAIEHYANLAKPLIQSDGSVDRVTLSHVIASMNSEAQQCFYLVLNWLMHGGEHVFLQDGNTLALRNGRLTDVLQYLKEKFPKINRITSYGRAESLARISAEEYVQLREAGLTRIHSGFESGSDEVLAFINKGVTAEEEIRAGRNIKAGGIEFSVYFMPGVGGKALSEQNALGTARVISEIEPDFVRMRTVAIKPNTDLYTEFLNGNLELCSDDDKVREIQLLLEHAHCENTIVASDHIINLLPNIQGRLKEDKEKMLGIIDEYFSLSDLDRRLYQLLRRHNAVETVADMKKLNVLERRRLEQMCKSVKTEKAWAEQMNELLTRYV